MTYYSPNFEGIQGLAGSRSGAAGEMSTRSILAGLIDMVHDSNLKAGWWTDLSTGGKKQRNVGELLMLCVSELAEAMEGHRKSKMDDHLPTRPMLEVELADTIIRIFDMAGGLGLDVAGAFVEKLQYNAKRADHKIEARQADGGKKY